MFLRVGQIIVNAEEIAAISPCSPAFPYSSNESSDIVDIRLRTGGSVHAGASMSDVEEALSYAGLMCDNPQADSCVPDLTDAEIETLTDLYNGGYLFLARDKDGKLYAYQHRPEWDGAYWSIPGAGSVGTTRITSGFEFIDSDADTPTEIEQLLACED